MKQELKESILEQLSRMNGQVGFYYKNLISSETLTYHENEQFRAASVVKLPLLAGMMLMREQGRTSFDELITVHPDQMHPGYQRRAALHDRRQKRRCDARPSTHFISL